MQNMIRISATALVCALTATAAYAGDRNRWDGAYGGIDFGFGRSVSNASVSSVGADPLEELQFPASFSFDRSGAIGGGYIGYSKHSGPVVMGLEADFQGTNFSNSQSTLLQGDEPGQSFGTSASSALYWLATLRGRVGFAVGDALIYGTGGVAFGAVNDGLTLTTSDGLDCAFTALVCSSTATASKSGVKVGYTLGGGLDYALDSKWSLKGEYQYINLGSTNLSGSATVTDPTDPTEGTAGSARINHKYNTFRLGLTYKFGG